MTKILITAAGSYGDIAPYTGLGARLRAAGHEPDPQAESIVQQRM